jgi:hypothetical protein
VVDSSRFQELVSSTSLMREGAAIFRSSYLLTELISFLISSMESFFFSGVGSSVVAVGGVGIVSVIYSEY